MSSKQRANVPTLPSGTVTFLFTDIEGSTRLWETQREAMTTALQRHDALLRRCIESHGGHIFKTVGDAFYAAFATAPSAVDAALAAQRSLHAERWPERAPIRARMALHTGAAEMRGGDYFGPPLNHVARLLAVGHGGQTLLSEITHDLCRDRLPAGMTLKSLGEHGLKDLARRETVFQFCHPDLPQAFPPLKTLLAPIDKNIPSIAQKLNVATILEGSVRKSGKHVRITTQLIQAATDSHLWSETYDRELEDIFAVQDDIAQSVVKELRSALLGAKRDASASAAAKAEVEAAAKGRGDNAKAYPLYLQGMFFADRITRGDLAKAIEYFRQAVELNPGFALAWAALSRAHLSEAGYSWAPVDEGFGRSRTAAERAIELEPDLAEGYVALGLVQMNYDWDWQAADASFSRALELAPGNAEVLRGAATLAGSVGRHEEAVALARRAVLFDPLSMSAQRSLGAQCLRAGLLDEAEAVVKKTIEFYPQGGLLHCWLGRVHLAQGRIEDARAAFEGEVIEYFRLQGQALAEHAQGQREKSDAALRELIDKYAQESAYQVAEVYAYRGEVDAAFQWLERAYAQHDPGLSSINSNALLRSLRGDPRWQPFLEKMKL